MSDDGGHWSDAAMTQAAVGNRESAAWMEREATRVRACEFGVLEEVVIVYRTTSGKVLVRDCVPDTGPFHAAGLLSWAKHLVLQRGGTDP